MSLYEARVYLGLLRHGPQNGNEVAKSAGIPSSKVYSTLEKLASEGIVHTVTTGSGTQYISIAPDELVHRFRQEFDEPIDYLEKTLPGLAAFEPASEVLTVTTLAAIRENSRFIVSDASRELYVSIWQDDMEDLRDALEAAHGRGVRVFGMLYGDEVPEGIGSWMLHSYQQIVADRLGGRMLTVVADGEEALIAHIPHHGQASGVRTRNPVLTLIAQEYAHHDLVLQRAQLQIGFDEWDRWWLADPDLRTIILGKSLETDEHAPATRRTKEEGEPPR
ncbi:putative transcriptional regulator [Gaiella occulta]|uniref:Putative transcriptional regulator n=2 Tax=Gaiella occulta TaxID=1002870 RepID=A0A7M2YUD3_9ACTN|nr:putative transcriptional regulator [Gaiella occulta]